MNMGVKLEQLTWGSWTPHKYKIAVSDVQETVLTTIKDFGVIGVDSDGRYILLVMVVSK